MQNVSLEELAVTGNIRYVNANVQEQTINAGGLTMDFILDERARAALGRTQKNGFSSFWKIHWRKLFMALKGGVGGSPTIFQRYIPIPAVALSSNSKLQQNPGY
jgi:hypothetical protein